MSTEADRSEKETLMSQVVIPLSAEELSGQGSISLVCEEKGCHCSLGRFSGGGLLGGAGAEDLVACSLSSCFTVSVGGSGSFFTSTAIQKAKVQRKLKNLSFEEP